MSAYEEGWMAFQCGRDVGDNPHDLYDLNDTNYDLWNDGWWDALEENEDKNDRI